MQMEEYGPEMAHNTIAAWRDEPPALEEAAGAGGAASRTLPDLWDVSPEVLAVATLMMQGMDAGDLWDMSPEDLAAATLMLQDMDAGTGDALSSDAEIQDSLDEADDEGHGMRGGVHQEGALATAGGGAVSMPAAQLESLLDRAEGVLKQEGDIGAEEEALARDLWMQLKDTVPGAQHLAALKVMANSAGSRDDGYSEPVLNVLSEGQDYMAPAADVNVAVASGLTKTHFDQLVVMVQQHLKRVTSNPESVDSPAAIISALQSADGLSNARIDAVSTAVNKLGVSRDLTAAKLAIFNTVKAISPLVGLFLLPGYLLGYQIANRGFHMPADCMGIIACILASYRPTSEALSCQLAKYSTMESAACMVIQKGVIMDSADPEALKMLQLLFLDAFFNGAVWRRVLKKSGKYEKVQISIDERVRRLDDYTWDGALLTWGYTAETAVLSINAARAKLGKGPISPYALIWGHAPWNWVSR